MTRREIENVIWRATMITLGYDPDASETQGKVRISWPLTETGNPDWGREENIVFLRLSPISDDYSSLWDLGHTGGTEYKESVSNHEAYEAFWLCYGPDVLETAQKLRYGIGRENIREYLNSQSMAIKPVITNPVYTPEQDRTGEWWERYDVRAQFYCKQTRQYSEGYIDTTPSISIVVNSGEETAFVDVDGGDVAPATGIALDFTDIGSGNIVITEP